MFEIDSCSKKKSLPLLIALLVVAQVDLACSAGWPQSLLAALHLTAANNDLCSGVCAGLGVSLDVLVIYQLVRMWAKRALRTDRDAEQD